MERMTAGAVTEQAVVEIAGRRVVVDDPGLVDRVRTGLAAVEERLAEVVDAEHPLVDEMARHLLDAGGKRFRPVVVLLAAEHGDPSAPGVVDAAVAIELTHLSTLYHDDVMDGAPLRRGVPTAGALWGNSAAVLTGDYLFARASQVTADLGPEATRVLARTIATLCQGQIREAAGPRPGQDPVTHVETVAAEKTGALVATSAHLGARLAGAPPAVVEALTRFGGAIGAAFQARDDLLDLVGSAAGGKAAGTDLREGVATLPLLLALRGQDATAARLAELTADGPVAEEHVAEALELLRTSAGYRQARARLEADAAAAREMLADVPDVAARRALAGLCDVVVERTA